jgi:hypothetical protein
MEKSVDSVHEAVDRAGPVHHGLVAIAASGAHRSLASASPVARVAEQGAGEAKGRMGVSVSSSLGLGRQWSGGA